MLSTFMGQEWHEVYSVDQQKIATEQLENGHVLFFPHLLFSLEENERQFLSPHFADPHAKNISYHLERHQLWGVQRLSDQKHALLKVLMNRFATSALSLVENLFPLYKAALQMGRTSFRPVEIGDRKTSYRKDDKRLHVDAFPSAPNQGKRILRVFTNVNPHGQPRVWRLGEPFQDIADRFLPQLSTPVLGARRMLRLLHITKSYRTLYDHYMLGMHDAMKKDEIYQKTCSQREVYFPPHTTWIAQTDQVSHAAMKGQYVLEQTFYLPVEAMHNATLSPLKILESKLRKNLV